MARAKKAKRPTLPQQPEHWDKGATGPANRLGLRAEPVTWTNESGEKVNPNNVKRMRRVDMFDKYGRDGTLTARQYDTGQKLKDAWLRTMPSGGSDYSDPIVDRTPQFGNAITNTIDRISAHNDIAKHIPQDDHDLIDAVVYGGRAVGTVRRYRYSRTPNGKARLGAVLDIVADCIGC